MPRTRSSKPAKNCILGRSCGSSCVSKLDKCFDESASTKKLAAKIINFAKRSYSALPDKKPEKLSIGDAKLALQVFGSKNTLLAMKAGTANHPHFKKSEVSELQVRVALKGLLKGRTPSFAKIWLEQRGLDFFTGKPLNFGTVSGALLVQETRGGKREIGNIVLTDKKIADFRKQMSKDETSKALNIFSTTAPAGAAGAKSTGISSKSLAKIDRLYEVAAKVQNQRNVSSAVDNKINAEFSKLHRKLLSNTPEDVVSAELKRMKIDGPLRNNEEIMKSTREYLQIFGPFPKTLEAIRLNMSAQDRAFATANTIVINRDTPKRTVFHELSHHREGSNPEILKASTDYRTKYATGGAEKLQKLTGNSKYDISEVAYKGNYPMPYIGKIMPTGLTEVYSVGSEALASPASMKNAYQNENNGRALLNLILDSL